MGELRDFVSDVLDIEGSAVEAVEPDGLEVLAPEPLRTSMGWPELVRLGFGAELPAGAMAVGFEGDWLDRFGALLRDRGRWAERQLVLPDPMPRIAYPERLLDHALDLPNAIWRLHGVSTAWARCLLLAFRYTAVSDEKREGLVWLGFNQGTGAVIDDVLARLRPLLAADTEWQAPDPDVRHAAGPAWDAPTLEARVRPLLKHRVRLELEPFLRTMRRRLDRDRNRVHEYHDDLRLVAQKRLAALPAPGRKGGGRPQAGDAAGRGDRAGISAKLDDLRHNYALARDDRMGAGTGVVCSGAALRGAGQDAVRAKGPYASTGTQRYGLWSRRQATGAWDWSARASSATIISISPIRPANLPAYPVAERGAAPATPQPARAAGKRSRDLVS